MKDNRNSILKFGAVILIIVFGLVYIYFALPPMQVETDALRFENKTLIRDITEIDAMGGDISALNLSIAEQEEKIETLLSRSSVDSDGARADISAKVQRAGLEIEQISLSPPEFSGATPGIGYELDTMPISLVLRGSYEDGVKFLSSIETSRTATYRIEQFAYFVQESDAEAAEDEQPSGTVKTDETDADEAIENGRWMINLTLYFYGFYVVDAVLE
ncbi:MAG: hypothetical protein LBN36_07060 [Clostridiales Family XIII bacterium]|jgi:Tfp pilus assembly protein PilO|nr:hypothetical protein [Clostridiales Family XIII bacterium]